MIEQVSVVDNLNTAIEGKMEIAVIGNPILHMFLSLTALLRYERSCCNLITSCVTYIRARRAYWNFKVIGSSSIFIF